MRGAYIFSFLLFSLLSKVYSTPIPGALKIMTTYDPANQVTVHQNQDRVAALRKANKEANSQYKHMERVLANPEKPEHAAVIRKAFGVNSDLEAIKKNVKTLKQKTLLIKTVEEPFNPKHPGLNAFSKTRKSDRKKHPHFTDRFFNTKTALGQAGTLIHEASHQLFNTKDNFQRTAQGQLKPVSRKEAGKSKLSESVKSGYLHKDFNDLRKNASPLMHQNADSYKVFGHYAKYGANTAMVHKVGQIKALASQSTVMKLPGGKVATAVTKTAGSRRPIRSRTKDSPKGPNAAVKHWVHGKATHK